METARRSNSEQSGTDQRKLADVLIYSYMLADNLNLDLDEIIEEKLKKNCLKYPLEKSKGQRTKYTEL